MGFVKQLLAHGKLITKANFPTFVETWNWLVEGFGNLRGDADVNGDTGHIKVDRTDPKHPVIRLTNFGTLGGGEEGGGGGGGGIDVALIDGVSIDKNSGNKLEIAHFADGSMDSGNGLANRLKVNRETGEITSDEKDVMLVARKNGKVIYIPFGGEGQDPTIPEEATANNPCGHPEGGDSVSAGGVEIEGETTPDYYGGGGVPVPDGGEGGSADGINCCE